MTQLVFDAQTFLNFRDYDFTEHGGHGYRWVDVKSFRIPQDTQDSELLTALIAHEQFRDDYAGGGVEPSGTRHGPYWLKHVTEHSYQLIGKAEALSRLRDWVDQHGPVPESLEADLASQVFAIVDSATSCYSLGDLGSKALHDWGGVHVDFHEYVAVDQERLLLRLVVAADD
ncbi:MULTISPECIES: hypothetical protein [Streptacidiphilus]|uniref:Uncharacterized protein n=1 Tax=Streptacidiphilus cavernicola TaxID=3342716 RepID=A0ABV6UIJ9_9ACTN|nr:hypothetical protein [Streptacidiphilus jeojiense]